MDWSLIGTLIVAGTIGAWVGMKLSRYFKRKREDKGRSRNEKSSQG